MSSNYRYAPDPSAILGAPWNITILSERDVALRVPINYVTGPAVSVTAACFGGQRYEDYATVKCISNLLAVGFGRLYLDLYWDTGRRSWSFCPVSLPIAADLERKETIAVALGAFSSTALVPSTSKVISSPSGSVTAPATPSATLQGRQIEGINTIDSSLLSLRTSSTTVKKATVTVRLSTAGTEAYAALPTATPTNVDEILYAVGPYTCSGTSAIDILTDLLPSFLRSTDDTLHALMQYVVFNIHAAASIAAPDGPAPAPSAADLPSEDELLGQYFMKNTSSFVYSPRELYEERLNLTDYWFDNDYNSTAPYMSYFEGLDLTGGSGMTDSGWPSTSYTEFRTSNHLRLLFGTGSVDPQMMEYDFVEDSKIVFSQDYISDFHRIPQGSDGTITDGCIFDPSQPMLSSANNSWAIAEVPANALTTSTNQTYPSVANLTSCGFSPLLNTTLNNTSADVNIAPYRAFAISSLWSWAPGEPRNARFELNTTSLQKDPEIDSLRCAVMDPTIAGGRWRTANCSDSYHAACRVDMQPYQWQMSESTGNYSTVGDSCPRNSSFGTPRTALENRYLLSGYQRFASGNDSSSTTNLATRQTGTSVAQQPLYLNLNSQDVPSCWVVGVHTSCPYEVTTDNAAQIYIPTVAGIIILIIAVMLVVIKCGANRATSRRRRRRGADGWDYEGVPS